MFKKLLGGKQENDLFELLTEDVDAKQGVPRANEAILGQYEAMSRQELISRLAQQSELLKELQKKVSALTRQNELQKQLYNKRDTSNELSKQYARVEAQHERDAQFQRDQFQIRMKELSTRVANLESKLLASQSENSRLIKLLTDPSRN
ncbi:MAG: hypothetical protein AAF197_10165 [Pseudomonadota bacterium]